jgi:hypothetical protein
LRIVTARASETYRDRPHGGGCRSVARADAWRERREHRFNRGENGHGQRTFSILQLARLGRMLSRHPHLDAHYDALI